MRVFLDVSVFKLEKYFINLICTSVDLEILSAIIDLESLILLNFEFFF